jgi:hypothetical protein
LTLTELNLNGVVLFVLLLIGGFALGVRATNRTRAMAVASTLLVPTAVGRILSAMILRVDPRRDTGTVPLPEPLASLASWTAIALLFLAPAVGGWLGERFGLASRTCGMRL